jgi:hypothetical protein
MGWYATYQALKTGTGPYGTVKESLRGETDPFRTLSVALAELRSDAAKDGPQPDANTRRRCAYWHRRLTGCSPAKGAY